MFVKICGTTSEEDALLAHAMGADAVGFIFAPSPRQVSPQLAAEIARRLHPDVVTVGVFRDEAPERVATIVNRAGLKAAQLHGHETFEQVQWVAARVPMTIKALPAGHVSLGSAGEYGADIILLDAASPGSGRVFDWSLVEGIPDGQRFMLAGGLRPDNVAEAIARTHPWGVDAATGVEASPGRKDPTKLRAFIANAKAAEPPAYESPNEPPYDWEEDAG
ncbi:MAG TPA: phosphoribosylanthranilate isomerase [Acidimicrobiales bacterium]|nr:phosphoribosylanthranilate isomerase [Acidimicrobiales bacterium]